MSESVDSTTTTPEPELDLSALTAAATAMAEAKRVADEAAAALAAQLPALRLAAAAEAEAMAAHTAARDEAIAAFVAQWDADNVAPTTAASDALRAMEPPAPVSRANAAGRRGSYDEAHAEAWLRNAIANPPQYRGKPLNVANMYDTERCYRTETGRSVNHEAFTELRVSLLDELAA